VFGKNGSDSVKSLMSGEAFSRQASNRANDGPGVFGNLVFNDRVKDCMGLQVGQLDSSRAVMCFDEPDSRLFIERKPLLGVGGVVWVVAIHDAGFVGCRMR